MRRNVTSFKRIRIFPFSVSLIPTPEGLGAEHKYVYVMKSDNSRKTFLTFPAIFVSFFNVLFGLTFNGAFQSSLTGSQKLYHSRKNLSIPHFQLYFIISIIPDGLLSEKGNKKIQNSNSWEDYI